MTKRLVKLSVATALGLATMTTASLAVELDTLVIYSQGAADKYNGDVETRIDHLIETTNKIYKDSGLDVTMNAVKVQQYDMNDSARSGTVLGEIRTDPTIAKLRNEVGADNVVMMRPYAHDGVCGIAYQNNYLRDPNATWVEKYMYAHVTIGCGGYVTAHEVGHNSGLGHSEKQGSTGAYKYARGHGVQDTFTTVMAYSGVYNGKKVYKYSSPLLECTNGLPCGIAEGEDKEADAVKALKQTLPLIEKFRAHIDNPDNNNTDNNGTTDGADKLAAALKAYNDQKTVVSDNLNKLKELRATSKELRADFLDVRDEYMEIRADFLDVRAELKKILSDYRDAVTTYKQAKVDYKNKKITKKAFLDARANLIDIRDEYKTFRSEEYLPALNELKTFRAEELKPLYDDYKKAISVTKTFYKYVYQLSKVKLDELKKAYLELKKANG